MRIITALTIVFWMAACSSDGPAPDVTDASSDTDADQTMTDGGSQADGASSVDAPPQSGTPIADCLGAMFVNPEAAVGPDYDQFPVTVGSHCMGTNHQDITGIERVVFLGDSVTVGTPPTLANDFYRSRLADALVDRFGLDAPNTLWKNADPVNGTSVVQDSGDFSSCAEWGARTDDFMQSGSQISDCFPAGERSKRTLVVITMGGNDVASITKDGIDGVPVGTLMVEAQQFIDLMRGAVEWFYDDPGKFPNGVFVIFANVYEYTDGTADIGSCPGASLAGFDGEWDDPQALKDMMLWINEQYMAIAADTGTDMLFLLEGFCGHGFRSDDPTAACYRGPGNDNWFDATCIHPDPTGHGALSDMFLAIIDE